jgi:hypothetical protein
MTMSYYIATRTTPSATTPGIAYRSSMLHEPASKGDLEWLRKNHDHVEKVDGATAHKWVRDGLPHSTGLYLDYNYYHRLVVRKATEEKDR